MSLYYRSANYWRHISTNHRHRNRWTANSDEIWLNLRRACAGSKPDTSGILTADCFDIALDRVEKTDVETWFNSTEYMP